MEVLFIVFVSLLVSRTHTHTHTVYRFDGQYYRIKDPSKAEPQNSEQVSVLI